LDNIYVTKTKNMNSIKLLKNGDLFLTSHISFAGEDLMIGNHYRPYLVSDLPNNFGCIEYGTRHYSHENELLNAGDLTEGINQWINHKGLTYIARK